MRSVPPLQFRPPSFWWWRFCLPFGIPSQKGGVLCRVFAFRGSFIYFAWSLWSLDCIYVLHIVFYLFNSCHIFVGIFMLRGVFFFVGTLYVSCFKLFIDLYLWVIHWYMSLLCVVWNQEVILFTCIVSTHAVMHFV